MSHFWKISKNNVPGHYSNNYGKSYNNDICNDIWDDINPKSEMKYLFTYYQSFHEFVF